MTDDGVGYSVTASTLFGLECNPLGVTKWPRYSTEKMAFTGLRAVKVQVDVT